MVGIDFFSHIINDVTTAESYDVTLSVEIFAVVKVLLLFFSYDDI